MRNNESSVASKAEHMTPFALNDVLKPRHQTRRDCRKDVTFFAQPPVCCVQWKKNRKKERGQVPGSSKVVQV